MVDECPENPGIFILSDTAKFDRKKWKDWMMGVVIVDRSARLASS